MERRQSSRSESYRTEAKQANEKARRANRQWRKIQIGGLIATTPGMAETIYSIAEGNYTNAAAGALWAVAAGAFTIGAEHERKQEQIVHQYEEKFFIEEAEKAKVKDYG